MEQIERSPRFTAKMAGLFYLGNILAGIFAQGFISERLVVPGDAAATSARILANGDLFQIGFTVYMIEMACQITATVLMYFLLKPVSRKVAMIAVSLGLAGCIIKTFSRVFYLLPLFILGSTRSLTAFSTDQREALTMLSLAVNDRGAGMAMAFFGFSTLLTGYLMFKSGFLPRALGAWSAIGGLGWLTFLYPRLGNQLFLYLAAFALLGSIALVFWLLRFGVDEQKWKELAEPLQSFRKNDAV